MVESVGYSGKHDYLSKAEDGGLFKLENDLELMNLLGRTLTSQRTRVVSIYVDHLYVPNLIESQVGSSDARTLNETVVPINVPPEPFQPLDPFETIQPTEVEVEIRVSRDNEEDDRENNEMRDSDEEDKESSESDCNTGSENSTDLDYFSESDYDLEKDDEMFDASTDRNVEWEGLRDREGGNGDAADDVSSDFDEPLESLESSSDEEVCHKKKKKKVSWPAFNSEADMEDPQFQMGMLFRSSQQLKAAIQQHAIKQGRQVKIKVCDKNRVRAICREGCNWILYASSM